MFSTHSFYRVILQTSIFQSHLFCHLRMLSIWGVGGRLKLCHWNKEITKQQNYGLVHLKAFSDNNLDAAYMIKVFDRI